MGEDKDVRLVNIQRSGRPAVQSLTSISQVIDREGELKYLEKELRHYRAATSYDRHLLNLVSSLTAFGVPESYCRMNVATYYKGSVIYEDDGVNYGLSNRQYSSVKSTMTALKRFGTIYLDEDTDAVVELLNEGGDGVRSVDVMREKLRSSSASTGLLDMQVDWLRSVDKKRKKAKKVVTPPVVLPESNALSQDVAAEIVDAQAIEEIIPAQGYSLEGREVFWTTRLYSLNPNHWVQLSTDTPASTVQDLQREARGQISISPASVLGAVEFHLRRDNMQRALAVKNKYLKGEDANWIKIKRGRDRIMIYVPKDREDQLILFAAGRDVVYRGR